MKRFTTESFEEYRLRRRNDNDLIKILLKSYIIWDSKHNGTYYKQKHGLIGEKRNKTK